MFPAYTGPNPQQEPSGSDRRSLGCRQSSPSLAQIGQHKVERSAGDPARLNLRSHLSSVASSSKVAYHPSPFDDFV